MNRGIFYCDIVGTFDCCSKKLNVNERREQLQNFANSLDRLCKTSKHDEIIFGFISSNPLEDVLVSIKEFLPYIKRSKYVKFGSSFSENHKIDCLAETDFEQHHEMEKIKKYKTGKPFQIYNHINEITRDELNRLHANIDKIYFADDAIQQHQILRHFLPAMQGEIELVDFVPGIEASSNNVFGAEIRGLDGTIAAINKYTKVKSVQV